MNYLLKINNLMIIIDFILSLLVTYFLGNDIVSYLFTADIGRKKSVIILNLIVSSILPCLWLFRNNYIYADLLAISLVIFVLLNFPRISYKLTVLIAIGLLIYDVISVFHTKKMVEAATESLRYLSPTMLYIPDFSNLASGKFSILGLGDICLPGIIIKAEINRSREENLPKIWKIYIFPVLLLAVYFASLVIGFKISIMTNSPQPALLYIIPAMLIAIFIINLSISKSRI